MPGVLPPPVFPTPRSGLTRCSHCGSVKLVRKGTHTKKLETVQLWRCIACARVFTPAPAALRHKTYPRAVILDGITFYNLGLTLAEAAAKLKSRHGHAIASWVDEHRDLATYALLRDAGRRLAPPTQTIRTVKLYHRQVYEYAYHRPKLALLAESAEHARFTGGIASFLEAVPSTRWLKLEERRSRASPKQPTMQSTRPLEHYEISAGSKSRRCAVRSRTARFNAIRSL